MTAARCEACERVVPDRMIDPLSWPRLVCLPCLDYACSLARDAAQEADAEARDDRDAA